VHVGYIARDVIVFHVLDRIVSVYCYRFRGCLTRGKQWRTKSSSQNRFCL